MERPVAFRDPFTILTVSDLAASLRFYCGLLGFSLTYQFPPEGTPEFVVVALGAATIGLGQRGETSSIVGGPIYDGRDYEICIYTSDVDEAARWLEASDVPKLLPPTDQPWGERLTFFQDPDGNRIHITAPIM